MDVHERHVVSQMTGDCGESIKDHEEELQKMNLKLNSHLDINNAVPRGFWGIWRCIWAEYPAHKCSDTNAPLILLYYLHLCLVNFAHFVR
jgi:hypothetical protein